MGDFNEFQEITKEELKLSSLGVKLEDDKQVFDLDKKQEDYKRAQSDSLEATKKQMHGIAEALESRELNFDNETRAKLEIRQGRNMSHILINSHKFLGDSSEMKDIKTNLLTLENALASELDANIPVSAEEITNIENMYMLTINSCQHYLNVKTTHTGNSRYTMVYNRMNSLTEELALFTKMKGLVSNPDMKGFFMVGSYSELIMSAKLYDLGVRYSTSHREEDVIADKLGEFEIEEPVTTSLPEDIMSGLDTAAQDILNILTMNKKPDELISTPGDDYCDITTSLLQMLRNFPDGVHAAYFNSGTIGYKGKGFIRSQKNKQGKNEKSGTTIGLKQDEKGRLFVKIGEFEQQLPYTKEVIASSMTNNILNNSETFGTEVLNDSMAWIKDSVFSKNDSATVRNMCLKYIAGRTGIEPTKFHNLDTSGVRMIARYLLDDSISKEEITEVLYEDMTATREKINGMDTLELLKNREKNKEKVSDKVRFREDAIINAQARSLLDPNAEGPDGWTPNEKMVKNLLADLVFSKDTWVGDNSLNEPSVRLRKAIEDNSYAFIQIAKDERILADVMKKLPLPDDFKYNIRKQVGTIRMAVHASDYADAVDNAVTSEERLALTKAMLADDMFDTAFNRLDEEIDRAAEEGARSISEDIALKVDRLFEEDENDVANKQRDEAETERLAAIKTSKRTEADIKAGNAILENIIKQTVKGNAGQGLFTKNVLKFYFSGVSTIDKRSMIASALRDSNAIKDNLTDAQKEAVAASYIGGVFKGAGPLMQKMLQGMPVDNMADELKSAFNDVKSNLLPIPRDIVEAQFLSMIERSNGAVTDIQVTKSLGAASVGQAFLCKIYGPSLPATGKEVVVKLLRPDVRNRMQREKDIMLFIAKITDGTVDESGMATGEKGGMEATYEGQLLRIEEELDLTIEARNVERGKIYDKSRTEGKERDAVSSMKLNSLVEPTTTSMVIEKSPGTTVDKYMDELARRRLEIIDQITARDEEGRPIMNENGSPQLASNSYIKRNAPDTKVELSELIAQAKKRQAHLVLLAEKWIEEGLFGSGFYHGDLHAGNIMIDDDSATVIDFGNATQLDKSQLGTVTKMMAAAAIGEEGAYVDGFHKLMQKNEKTEALWKSKKKQFETEVKKYFRLGSGGSTGQRIAVTLLKAQELGFELPSAIFNFSQCQLRLQNTITELNEQIAALEGLKKSIDDISATLSMDSMCKIKRIAAEGDDLTAVSYGLEAAGYALIYYEGTARDCFKQDLKKMSQEERDEFDRVFRPETLADPVREDLSFPHLLKEIRDKLDSGQASEEEIDKLVDKAEPIFNVFVYNEWQKERGSDAFQITAMQGIKTTMLANLFFPENKDEEFARIMEPYLTDRDGGQPDEITRTYREVVELKRQFANGEDSEELEKKRKEVGEKFIYLLSKKQKLNLDLNKDKIIEELKVRQAVPRDFVDVMGRVISDNSAEAASRIGFWGLWHKDELTSLAK